MLFCELDPIIVAVGKGWDTVVAREWEEDDIISRGKKRKERRSSLRVGYSEYVCSKERLDVAPR